MAWRYGWFAERYRWTPTQVDEQPLWVIRLFPTFAGAVDEAKAALQEEAQSEARQADARKR